MRLLGMLCRILVVVGALNWGLWGFFQFDLVAALFGGNATMMARVIYSLVGLAGVYSLKCLFKCPCSCHDSKNGGCCK
jgi:uncharacterized protein